ncbi:hypothetical protein J437_LFUL010657 [Ladona fulva]|uniref:RNA exonuclease 1 homolog-like domain-containing protein n=1 Tax=Ladona fulva TaxID=123851 RepID=A0A8K0KEA2_LADFU|nr:hypothetical protein J437_LFUL010657 [Ladona fulva]
MVSRFAKLAQEKSTPSSSIFPKPALSTGKVRIAHVPNVSKILDAKKNLSAAVQVAKPEPTVPQSLPKDDTSGVSRPKVRHEDVIGGKSKAKGLWSIVPAKKATITVDENLAYKIMTEKYVLSEEELVENGYPRSHPTEKGRAVMIETMFRSKTKSKNYFERICDRCGKEYMVNERGLSRTDEQCVYHWGRPYKTRVMNMTLFSGITENDMKNVTKTLLDIQATMLTMFNKKTILIGHSLDSDLKALKSLSWLVLEDIIRNKKSYLWSGREIGKSKVKGRGGVEGCFTKETKLQVGRGGEEIWENIWKSAKVMWNMRVNLENIEVTCKAQLIHDTVVDTSIVFPHRRGPPFKRALKTLSAEILQKIIQSGEEGHDSAEDALACMELMKWRIKEDLKLKKNNMYESCCGCKTLLLVADKETEAMEDSSSRSR